MLATLRLRCSAAPWWQEDAPLVFKTRTHAPGSPGRDERASLDIRYVPVRLRPRGGTPSQDQQVPAVRRASNSPMPD
jgi:hypothetical protein